jgi:hypothetical protein
MVHTTLGWFRPKFLVRTRKKWYSPATRFEPHCWSKPRVPGSNRKFRYKPAQSGVNHEAGSYHLFLVCTSKVVQTTKQWYEPSVVQTTSGWSGPLFLVQTTKTWSIPIFFRLLSFIPRVTLTVLELNPVSYARTQVDKSRPSTPPPRARTRAHPQAQHETNT